MIAKCAESLALRKAFPDCLAGLYTNDEMGQADGEPADVKVIEPKNEPKKKAKKTEDDGKATLKQLLKFSELMDEMCEILKWDVKTKETQIKGLLKGRTPDSLPKEVMTKVHKLLSDRIKAEKKAMKDLDKDLDPAEKDEEFPLDK